MYQYQYVSNILDSQIRHIHHPVGDLHSVHFLVVMAVWAQRVNCHSLARRSGFFEVTTGVLILPVAVLWLVRVLSFVAGNGGFFVDVKKGMDDNWWYVWDKLLNPIFCHETLVTVQPSLSWIETGLNWIPGLGLNVDLAFGSFVPSLHSQLARQGKASQLTEPALQTAVRWPSKVISLVVRLVSVW